MATKKTSTTDTKSDIKDARDALDSGMSTNDNFALLLRALTSIEEKLEAIDWKLWEMYQMGLNQSPQNTSQQPAQQPVQYVQQPVPQPQAQEEQSGGVLKNIFGKK